jgi:hypothetical protein
MIDNHTYLAIMSSLLEIFSVLFPMTFTIAGISMIYTDMKQRKAWDEKIKTEQAAREFFIRSGEGVNQILNTSTSPVDGLKPEL